MSKLGFQVSPGFVKANPEYFGTGAKVPDPAPAIEAGHKQLKVLKQKKQGMNKLEERFLAWLNGREGYLRIIREGIGIRLGNGVVYWPDFTCTTPEGRTLIWETKGMRKSTGQAKLKIAATMHPEWKFIYVEAIPSKDGGGFQFQEVNP